jgi:basic membrane protein A and related proteins
LRRKQFAAGGLALLVAAIAVAGVLVTPGGAGTNATFKAALISDVGHFNDKSFNQSQLNGLNKAKRVLKVNVLPIQSNNTSDYVPNLNTAVRQGANIVMAAGFLLAPSLKDVAAQFPNTKFTITDDFVSSSAGDFKGANVHNIEGLTYATQENSYLIGCMAAMVVKAKYKGTPTIGVVGGIKIPPVDVFLAGYKAGARKCVKNTVVKTGYSQDFVKQDLCKNVAEDEIASGAKIIFGVAGLCGLGALNAAKEHGLFGIGVDQDQSFLGPFILTSAVKRVDVGIFDAIKAAKSGKFKGGSNLVFNLKNNGVALGKISPRLTGKLRTQVLAKVAVLRKQIISGKIKPPTGL